MQNLFVRSSVVTRRSFQRAFSRGEKVFFRDGKERRFKIGWSHMRERSPRTLQEQWHRSMSIPARVVNYDLLENVTSVQKGERDSFDWRCYFETTKLGDEPGDLKNMSPWHDIPLCFEGPNKEVIFNYVNEIPKGERAKMECSLKEEWNPLKQDIKKEKLRYFTYGDLPFNYGFLPQTWECPDTESPLTGLVGDNDPIDVVEVSSSAIEIGTVTSLKVLGVLGMIDEGETDWKVIGVNTASPEAATMNSIDDVPAEVKAQIVDWFKMYKTTDGKPENTFYKDAEFLDWQETMGVIAECHHAWMNLLLGRKGNQKKYALDSVMFKMLQAQKLVSSADAPMLGSFHILNVEEKFPSKADIERVENDPKFGEGN